MIIARYALALLLLLALVFPTRPRVEGFVSAVTEEQCVMDEPM